ncbi:MAG: helix-turn-helix transcriptional regulator [Synergistaceae bacterium]|nr:helix-turn-helix transcriptional regulator [Synergistaceae bacterium]MBQ4400967.1 helix-turn-helix transcriptional regulator [Synergistaceae bacterium]MBQ6664604.1 helix-turn-helix transcriptional regulator [Synergistaceae bacterium]
MKIRRYRFPRPAFVADNINSLKQIRSTCSISLLDVGSATLIPITLLQDWEAGTGYPSQTNYNKLAAFFDWEAWL